MSEMNAEITQLNEQKRMHRMEQDMLKNEIEQMLGDLGNDIKQLQKVKDQKKL